MALPAGTSRASRPRLARRDGALPGLRVAVAGAGLALQQCLAPDLLELFLATCGRPGKRSPGDVA